MPGPFHGWMLIQDSQGNAYEVINQARTAAYLAHPDLTLDDVAITDVLDFGGCATYALGPDEVVASGGYIDFPGSAGNYAEIPSGSVPAMTGDLTVTAELALDDWSPATTDRAIVSRHGTVDPYVNQRSWTFALTTAGALQLRTSADGASNLSPIHTSTANLSATAAGGRLHVGVTFQANNGASGRSTRFWTSTDGSTWTQLGTTQTTAGTTSLFATTAPIRIAYDTIGAGAAGGVAGNVYDVSIRNGVGTAGVIGGTEVFHFDGDTDLAGYTAWRAGTDPTIITSTGDPMTIYQDGTPSSTPHVATSRCDLVPLFFDTPATDDCPWYNAAYPESCDALGFYVTEWTGLDDGHVRRDAKPRGGPGGGSSMGVVAAEGRTMALNIMLFARSEQAMDYLFRWLSNILNSVCSTCATNSVLIRRFCGDVLDPWNGVAELRQVGVVQGLKWESDVGKRARCLIRRASFTLMAGDPCMYLPATELSTHVDDYLESLHTYFPDAADDGRSMCRPSCSELPAEARTSRTFEVATMGTSLVVTWENQTNYHPANYTYPFRAIVYYDPLNIGTDNPNPCGLQILGELYVRALPPNTAVRWDVTGRQVLFRNPSTGGWTPSWTYVDANDPPLRRFFVLPCGTSHLVMEPASMCASTEDDDIWTLDGITFDPVYFPIPTLALSERVSCP